MENSSDSPARRRAFLTTLIGAVATFLAAAVLWPLWRYLAPKKKGEESESLVLPRSAVAVGIAHFISFRGRPAVVVQPSPGKFIALSAVCTHLGCIVKWLPDKGEFLCPCHAGRFSVEGRVLGGPPPEPLETLPVNIAGDNITIG